MPIIANRLKAMGITLPPPPDRAGLYTYCRFFGNNLVYLSGCGPALPQEAPVLGKVGAEVSLEEGKRAARNCVLNALSVLEKHIGDLDRVECFAKMLAFVASADTFTRQPEVADGASELLVELFGETVGCPARSAIGVNVLPGNIPAEVELLLIVKEQPA